MNPDAWPTPSEGASREPLPRVEDLPLADHGYDQASVKAAFDSFYRHAAQLDASLRTLEAVDSFERQAAALRVDLRTLRATGWTQQPFAAPPAYGYDTRAPREGVSPAVWRLLGEVVFLIAVAVFLGVAKVHWWVIVSVMGGAFLMVAIIEWAASRDRWSAPSPAAAPAHPIVEAQPAREPPEEGEPMGWAAYEQAQEPSDAMTMIGAPQEAEAPVAEDMPPTEEESRAVDEPEPVVQAAADDSEAEPEPPVEHEPEPASAMEGGGAEEPSIRRHWWQRRGETAEEDASEADAAPEEPPRNVRVLATGDDSAASTVDPWERGFDADEPAGESDVSPEPGEDTAEDETPIAAEADSPARRRFRRR